MSKQHKADFLLILVTAFWGCSYYLMTVCLQDLDPLNLNAIRFLLSAVFLGIIFSKRIKTIDWKTLKYCLWGALTLIIVYTGATYGVRYTSISNAGFIISSTVVITPLFEWMLFKRTPTIKQFIVLIVCVVGLGLMTLNASLRVELGDIFCLISAIASSLNLIITEQAVKRENIDPIKMAIIELAIVGFFMLALSGIFEKPHLPHSDTIWFCVLFLTFFCTCFAFFVQTTQQRYTKASNVGLIFAFEPVFSAVCAFIFANERLRTRRYVGAALMMISFIIMEIRTE